MMEAAARRSTRLPKLRNNIRLAQKREPLAHIRFGAGYKVGNCPTRVIMH